MTFNIHDFKANGLEFGGARPTNFHVELTIPNFVQAGNDMRKMSFLIKAGSIPNAPMESVDVHYFGRPVKFNGDRVFPDWEITVLNDEDFAIRRALEAWSNTINMHVANWQTAQAYQGLAYKSVATVTQFSKAGNPIATYDFEGLWPKELQQMDLDWGNVNTIQEFRCTFAYDLWTVRTATGEGGNAGPSPVAPPFDAGGGGFNAGGR